MVGRRDPVVLGVQALDDAVLQPGNIRKLSLLRSFPGSVIRRQSIPESLRQLVQETRRPRSFGRSELTLLAFLEQTTLEIHAKVKKKITESALFSQGRYRSQVEKSQP
jgi:hypothetical protein